MKLHVSKEVRRAMRSKSPVVVLESSVFAQGLPSPHNRDAYLRCSSAITAEGAVPAVVALLKGRVWIGADLTQLEPLMQPFSQVRKIGERDIEWAMVDQADGATTVSATCRIAADAGLHFFATGGIGGVHRGAADTFDISADLGALARYPVATVSAGAKTLLDLPKTLELLEALSVPVVGLGCNDFPGFFLARTGLPLDRRCDDLQVVAQWLALRFAGPFARGALLVTPVPAAEAVNARMVEAAIQKATERAQKAKVSGSQITPFVLSEVSKLSKGKTLRSNLSLLENNARWAARIARHWSRGGQ